MGSLLACPPVSSMLYLLPASTFWPYFGWPRITIALTRPGEREIERTKKTTIERSTLDGCKSLQVLVAMCTSVHAYTYVVCNACMCVCERLWLLNGRTMNEWQETANSIYWILKPSLFSNIWVWWINWSLKLSHDRQELCGCLFESQLYCLTLWCD